MISIVLAALAGVGLSVLLASCEGTLLYTYTETDLSKPAAQGYYRKFTRILGGKVLDITYETRVHDPQGHVVVTGTLKSIKGRNPARGAISAFGSADAQGQFAETYHVKTDGITVKGIVVLRASKSSAGSVCLSMSATSARPSGRDEALIGNFNVLGGTGKGARLHASGKFLAIQPSGNASSVNYLNSTVTFHVGVKKASLGSARGLSATCRAAGKAPAKPKATLDGFAFGPHSAQGGSLPPGTTIYPSGSTISGSVGCGASNNLYAVFTYSGPTGASAQVNFASNNGKGGVTRPLKQGRNNVLVLAAPPNSTYSIVGSVYQTGAATLASFDDRLTLSRTC